MGSLYNKLRCIYSAHDQSFGHWLNLIVTPSTIITDINRSEATEGYTITIKISLITIRAF